MKILKEIRLIIEKNRIYEIFFAENQEIKENYNYWLQQKKSLKK